MKTSTRIVPVFLLAFIATTTRADITGNHADHVCAPAANPCVVTQRIAITPKATLDFGTRTLEVAAGGQLDFGSGSADVIAGDVVIGGNGINAFAAGKGAVVHVTARRACSSDPAAACMDDDDCGAGTCAVGAGSLTLSALINGRTTDPAAVILYAAGDITVSGVVDVRGTGAESDGGSITMQSFGGSIAIAANLRTDSGRLGTAGWIDIAAANDLSLQSALSLAGGDADGGELTVAAERDVLVSADIQASAIGGAGYGGYIDVFAGRDVVLSGGTAADRVVLQVDGHQDAESFAGDGGDIDIVAGRDIVVGPFVSLVSSGARPDGYGGNITLWADGQASIAGRADAVADGQQGDGGAIAIGVGRDLLLASTSGLAVDGGSVGSVEIDAGGIVDLAGSVSLNGKQGGFGGVFSLRGLSQVQVSGAINANRPGTSIDLQACGLTLAPSAVVQNNASRGINTLTARETMQVAAGSLVATKNDGQNRLVFRNIDMPPLVQGTLTPAAMLVHDPTLVSCLPCGNGQPDPDEECDDGNISDEDECLSTCTAASCGDGFIHAAIEDCDDGNTDDTDACIECVTAICGDGFLQDGVEDCDDGNGEDSDGCSSLCASELLCADANGDGLVRATDSLRVLQHAVGQPVTCPVAVCDVNGDGNVLAGDALVTLRAAVGLPVVLKCGSASE